MALVGALSPVNHKRIISGLREAFVNRYIVERTNKAEIRPEEQRERESGELSGEFWNEIQLKGP